MVLSTRILCTVGPASLEANILKRLEVIGVSLFRINLSHVQLEDLENIIGLIKSATSVPICLDSEGAQVRTGRRYVSQKLLTGRGLGIVDHATEFDDEIELTPNVALPQLRVGDLLELDFNGATIEIEQAGSAPCARVLRGGMVGSCKGVALTRDIILPAISKKDAKAVEIAKMQGVQHFALSFANHPRDVDSMRSLVGDQSFLISKIETLSGIQNLRAIAQRSDAVLIDRGDLSREVRLEHIPPVQKQIVAEMNALGVPVYVATNLLESMVTVHYPTRAEINDIYNTLEDGADGLVLAAETAIGGFPVSCAEMLRDVIQVWENMSDGKTPQDWLMRPDRATLLHKRGSDLFGDALDLQADQREGLPQA